MRSGKSGERVDGAAGAVGRTLGVLADTWTLLILQRAFLGVRRYAGWRATLNISDATLAARLRSMTANGLLRTVPYRDGGRSRQEYRLTERGIDTWRLLLATWSWERAWEPREVPLPDVVHQVCGNVTDVVLSCAHCGTPIGPRDTEVDVAAVTGGADLARLHPRRTRGPLPSDPLSFLPGAMEIVGDRWGATLLGACLVGLRTFSEFADVMSISPEVLTDRLRRFVEHGVLVRTGQSGYRLTDKGRAAFAIHACLVDWANRWERDDGDPVDVDVRHRACGKSLEVRLDCAACGVPFERTSVAPAFREPGGR
ncbi:winged helix-turn-helix transcriptional regulator [Pseudonocardia endophytica]|uniref:HxlR family transcriptional regulator n=1 Tax=Pseudonocardia endophytica TaxID=401976 RepID=A0A4R1HFK4_PSEEN|nr:helix-turn-helix domain-containing protein [Pseudonocardia endophytica]TCK20448.1 HxlR family transcriptional regulator [Pseudonocardia endophytica]